MIQKISSVVLAFGANLGERQKNITGAARELAAHPEISEFRLSSLLETVKLGLHGLDHEAPKYLNAVALAATSLTPGKLLQTTRALEDKYGRQRGETWADRTLDIDIIAYGGLAQRDPQLMLPHPRAHERDFVLRPWLELDPHAVLQGRGRVSELLKNLERQGFCDLRGLESIAPE